MISKEDYIAWKNDKVSKAVFAAFHTKIQDGMDELSEVAGENPAMDNRRVGKLAGLRTFTEFTYYDITGEEE